MTRTYPRPTARQRHPVLSPRQLQVLRVRCEAAGRGEAAKRLDMTEWNVGRVLRTIRCCSDDAQACWEHRLELEAVEVAG